MKGIVEFRIIFLPYLKLHCFILKETSENHSDFLDISEVEEVALFHLERDPVP